jgi:UDP-N-acetylglucosamine 2-epimerase (non-hydrolysing)
VIVVGSPMREVLEHYSDAIDASDVISRLGLKKDGYFLVSAHREENIDDGDQFRKFLGILNAIAERFDLPVIVSTHPRTRNRIEREEVELDPRVRTLKPFGFLDYVQLQKQSFAVLSDSGTITEEASILNLRAVNIRETHERPEGMEEGAVMMTGMNAERVMQCLDILGTQGRGAERTVFPVSDYSSDNVSDKVIRIIHSYTDFVNRVVWQK